MIQIRGTIGDIPDNEDMGGFFDEAADVMYNSIAQNFVTGGRPDPWPAKRNGTPSHLFETGRLLGSIEVEVNPQMGYARVYVPRGRVPYAFAQNFGYPPAHLPQREFMLWQDEDIETVLELYKNHLLAFIQTSRKEV